MAKSKGNDKEEKFKFPSHFGSHASMIVVEETEKLADEKLVCLKDEHGTYVTERNRLDNKEADPNRYVTTRLNKLFARKEEKKSQ